MTKEELEIDNKRLDFNEKVAFVVKKEELKEQDIRLNKLCLHWTEWEKRAKELEKENAALRKDLEELTITDNYQKVISDKNEQISFLEAYNEKLLNSDIEKHNKIVELEAQIDNLKSIGKTSYIKGIRTMANALKDYDRTDGAWTDYFEHTVDETLKMLLKKGVIKENLTTKAECETQELLDKQIEATYKVVEELNEAKEIIKKLLKIINDFKTIGVLYDTDTLKQAEAFLKEEL